MTLETQLTEAVNAFRRLMALQNPDLIEYWHPPTKLREEYIQLAQTVVYALDTLKSEESSALLEHAEIESRISPEALRLLRTEIRQKEDSLWDALDRLDPDNKLIRELMVFDTRPSGKNGRVRNTFDLGLERVEYLVANDTDSDFGWTQTDLARKVMESKLIAFDPDAWLDRLGQLPPIRTSTSHAALPPSIRIRLRELYQVYTFGCWIAVISLSRATLEYALLEKLHPHRGQNDRGMSLFKLIETYSAQSSSTADAMHRLRKLGNEVLHSGGVGDDSYSSMRARHAAESAALLIEVLEDLYLTR